jgi:hypothetical protein
MISSCPVCKLPTIYSTNPISGRGRINLITCSKKSPFREDGDIDWSNHFIWFFDTTKDQFRLNVSESHSVYSYYWISIESSRINMSRLDMDEEIEVTELDINHPFDSVLKIIDGFEQSLIFL